MRHTRRTATVLTAVTLVGLVSAVAVAVGDPTPTPPPRTAIVARGDGANFADALAIGSVAGQLGAPVFTTTPTVLPEATREGLSAYAPELVIIPGGTAAVSAEVEAEIESATGLPDDKVVRAAGADRYETAVAIAAIFTDLGVDPAYLPTGATATDADLLDGMDSSDFALKSDLGAGGGDAETLDGMDSSDFQPAGDYLEAGDPIDADTLQGMGPDTWVTRGESLAHDVALFSLASEHVEGQAISGNESWLATLTLDIIEACPEGEVLFARVRVDATGDISGAMNLHLVVDGVTETTRHLISPDDQETFAVTWVNVDLFDSSEHEFVLQFDNVRPDIGVVNNLDFIVAAEDVICITP